MEIGDLVKVNNGSSVPTDGIVVFGQGFCDESMLTGESRLQEKKVGSEVYGGAVFEKGCLIVKVIKNSEDSSLSQILKLVDNA